MKKRTLSIILILCMMLTMLPVTALAASDTSCDGGESCKHEAAIGNTHYDTLSEAIEAAQAGETVLLLKDVQEKENITVEADKNLTLDLNGKTITETAAMQVKGVLTVEDTTATEEPAVSEDYEEVTYQSGMIVNELGGDGIVVLEGGKLTVNSGAIWSKVNNAVSINGAVTPDTWETPVASQATINGGYLHSREYGIGVYGNGAVLNVEGGVIVADDNAAVAGNGSKTASQNFGGTTINISGGTLIGHIFSPGYIAVGVYHPQAGELNITGGTIYADNGVGICIRNGALNISDDAEIIATGTEAGQVGDLKNQIPGKALVVDYAKGYDHNNGETYTRTVSISGGTFQAEQGAVEVYTTEGNEVPEQFITGGTFSSDPSAYMKQEGYKCELVDGKYQVSALTEDDAIAQVGEDKYFTLAEAVEKADNATVKLLQDVKENITIAEGKTLTLDLNGKTLTSNGSHAILNQGNLTVKDSVGGGAVVCPDAGKSALQNEPGATATIESGKLHKNRNVDSSDYYVITNHGKLVINGGEIVSDSANSSAIENGWYTPSQNTEKVYAELTINGGTVSNNGVTANGGLYTLKNDDYGIMEIHGGSFANTTPKAGTILNWNELTITDGEFTAQNAAVATMAEGTAGTPAHGYEKGQTTISGGKFAGILGTAEGYNEAIKVTVSGGYYTEQVPEACVAEGYLVTTSNEAGYKYAVEKKTETEVPVEAAVEAPVVNDKNLPSDMTPEDKEAVTNAAKTVNVPELGAYGNSVANQVTDEQATAAADKLKDAGLAEAEQQVKVYVQTYLDVQPTGYDAEKKELTVNITPMYKTVSSTADKAEDVKLDGDGKNAVVYDEGELKVAGAVEVTMTLPAGFAADDANLYVMHEAQSGTYYYKATLSGNTLSFTNPHGFSTFTVKEDDRTAVVDYGEYAEDATYTAANVGEELPTADAPSGKRFSGWKFNGVAGTYTTLTDSLLTALDEAYTDKPIEATPVFSKRSNNGGTAYTVNVQAGKGGDVEVSPERASKSTTITVTVKADDGYSVDEVTVTESNGDKVDVKKTSEGKYTFTMPASNVTVKATFTQGETPEIPFKDVAENAWYYEAVKYVYDNELMNGVKNDTFAPNSNLNRAMIAQVLYNLEGEPGVQGDAFSDVAEDTWYFDAVNWAAENKIVEGYGDGNFGPTRAVTREQLAAILFRYAQYKGMDSVTLEENLTGFTDGDQVSSWAVSAMNWAVGQGIMNGKGNNTLDPQGTATRAEVAKMLMVYLELK